MGQEEKKIILILVAMIADLIQMMMINSFDKQLIFATFQNSSGLLVKF